MTVSGQESGQAIPLPEDFPVDWESPGDATLFWRQDPTHWPDPISPLEFSFYSRVLSRGIESSARTLESPFLGAEVRRINTYWYQAILPYDGPAEEADARAARCQAKLDEQLRTLPELWERKVLPAVMRHLDWWDAFDLEGASLEELIEHLAETDERTLDLADLHFEIAMPAYVALSEFEELHRGLLGAEGGFDAYALLRGFENTTVASERALWELSRKAAASPEVRAVLAGTPPAEVPARLAATPEGRAFRDELERHLDRWGRRCQSWGMRAPSYVERPDPIVASVAELAKRSDDNPPAITTGAASEERKRQLEATRERLAGYPRAAVEEFEKLLRAAQAATVIQYDHNFYIDFCCSYRLRRLALEFGRRFAEAGVLEHPDDVFMLTQGEVRSTAEALPGLDRRELAAERAAEMERFAGVTPPVVAGALPTQFPIDNPFTRFIIKVNGMPQPPSERPDELNGSPGSSGKVRATARVIGSMAEAERLGSGEVLVAEMTAPPWTPLFARAAAVVTDTGGVLSHSAVVAREYGIPAVVGTVFGTKAIADGQTVEVDGDAGIVGLH